MPAMGLLIRCRGSWRKNSTCRILLQILVAIGLIDCGYWQAVKSQSLLTEYLPDRSLRKVSNRLNSKVGGRTNVAAHGGSDIYSVIQCDIYFVTSQPLSLGFRFAERTGQEWIRTIEGVSQRIYSPPRLATSVPTRYFSTSSDEMS